MHPGLTKYFSALSEAAKKVELRQEQRDKLRGYINKIRIVAAGTSKKSAITLETQKLEQHITDILDRKLASFSSQQESSSKVNEKEQELDMKISKLNEILAKAGKKVNPQQFKKELGKQTSELDAMEDKLYLLESKYYQVKDDPRCSPEMLMNIREKISLLKEKVRSLKNN